MKRVTCEACARSWIVEDDVLDAVRVCPFCDASVREKVDVAPGDPDTLGKAIYAAVAHLGAGSVGEPARLAGVMMDVAPGLRKEIHLFRRGLTDSTTPIVAGALGGSVVEGDLTRLRMILVDDEYLASGAADMLVGALREAAGYLHGAEATRIAHATVGDYAPAGTTPSPLVNANGFSVVMNPEEVRKPGTEAPKAVGTSTVKVFTESGFPDEKLRAAVNHAPQPVRRLDAAGVGIRDAAGIELLTDLTSLDLSNNTIGTVDLSRNTKLTELNLSGNLGLRFLNLSRNTHLSSLNLSGCNTEHIVLWYGARLKKLCDGASPNSPDPAVSYVSTDRLFAAAGWATRYIRVSDRDFPDERLRARICARQQIRDGYMSPESINALTKLSVCNCQVRSAKGIEHLIRLTKLTLAGNHLSEIDVSQNLALAWLDLKGNHIRELNVEWNPELTNLNLIGNEIHTLDLRYNTHLKSLYLYGNPLTTIIVPASRGRDWLLEIWKDKTDGDLRQVTIQEAK